MEGIKEYINNNNFVNQTKSELQQGDNIETEINTRITNYFDYIYSYPPKINIKWNSIDELNEDLFIGSNYGVLEHSAPFIDFIDDWFFNENVEKAVSDNYSRSNYFNGFLEKNSSSNFFLKKTKEIHRILNNIPVFVIFNGQGEIVLSQPSNVLEASTSNNFVTEKLYDSCGAFDPSVEKKSSLGLFFMSHVDAEKYLKEVARSDFEGTQTVGLSIHSISLGSAYKITREHHPGVDFRFVPNFNEVKELLTKNIGKSDMIVEDEQQQLRFRRRTKNLFPFLNKLGKYVSPTSSFLQRNEYFKGVPIYVIQLNEEPRNLIVEQYFNAIGYLDTFYNRCIQCLDSSIGFGHNWIMQGSLQDTNNPNKFTTYVFFEKDQVAEFLKGNSRKAARFIGGRTSNLEFMVRKPKVFVYNLEDFLEDWEDNILGSSDDNGIKKDELFKTNAIHFVSPEQSWEAIDGFKDSFQQNIAQRVTQALNVKFKVLKRSVGVFFSIN